MGRPRCELCGKKPRRRHDCACGVRVGTGCCWDAEALQCKRCHRRWAPLRMVSFGLPLELRLVLWQFDPWMRTPGPERLNRCGRPCEGREGCRIRELCQGESGTRYSTRCLGLCGNCSQHQSAGHQCVRCRPNDGCDPTWCRVLPWNSVVCRQCTYRTQATWRVGT